MKSMPKVLMTAALEHDLSTLVQRVVDTITGIETAGVQVAGFIKVEQAGKKGKSEVLIRNLDGGEVVVGTQGKGRGRRVGKFLIDVEAMESATLGAIGFRSGVDLYVIHEIGPIETMSRNFSETAKMLLKNDKVAVLATVAKQGRGFIREVKRLPGLDTIEVSPTNEAAVEEQVLKQFLMAFAARAKERAGA